MSRCQTRQPSGSILIVDNEAAQLDAAFVKGRSVQACPRPGLQSAHFSASCAFRLSTVSSGSPILAILGSASAVQACYPAPGIMTSHPSCDQTSSVQLLERVSSPAGAGSWFCRSEVTV